MTLLGIRHAIGWNKHIGGRISRSQLPERSAIAGASARQADLDLLAHAPDGFLDTTHFDTVRFPPPCWALDVFAKAASDGAHAYSPYRGHKPVLRDVAESVSRVLGVNVDPERHVILTPGTQGALFMALSSIAEEGGRITLLDPDYLFYARMARFLNVAIGFVPLKFDQDDPGPDLDALEAEFRKGSRCLVLSHPNNPTGSVFSNETITAICALAQRYNVAIVADELYARLLHDDRGFAHFAAQPGMFDHVVTLLGPSKTESLSGYRLGVAIAPRHIIEAMEDVLSFTSLRASAYAQHVLLPWLREDQEWLKRRLADFSALREVTIARFRQLPWIRIRKQRGTAYAWPDVSALSMPDVDIARALLQDAGVLVSPGYQFGPHANGHFRVCYAREEVGWSAALDRMTAVLRRLAIKRGL